MAFSFPAITAAIWQAGETVTGNDSLYLWIALAIGALGLLAAFFFARSVLGSDSGTPEMQRISDAIRQGAEAFM
jgi:K(+)-stimulated pyrophosphate-energized sodium pump